MPNEEADFEHRQRILTAIEERCQRPFGPLGSPKYLHIRSVKWLPPSSEREVRQLRELIDDEDLWTIASHSISLSAAHITFELAESAPVSPQIFQLTENGVTRIGSVRGPASDDLKEVPPVNGGYRRIYFTIHTNQLPNEVVADLDQFVTEALSQQDSLASEKLSRSGNHSSFVRVVPTLVGCGLILAGLIDGVSDWAPSLPAQHLIYAGTALLILGPALRWFHQSNLPYSATLD